jgi:hypothetical protein
MMVIFATAFQLYRSASTIINSEHFALNSITNLGTSLGFCFILWHAENRGYKIRPTVVAWAISVLVIYMLVFWFGAQIVFGGNTFQPPRALIANILDKGEQYVPGSGTANYLIPYWPEDKLPFGLARFSFFFPVPEDLALICGFVCLIALEIKKPAWRWSLFSSGVFLLFVSGTRSNWIVLPTILVLRFFIVAGKIWGPALIFSLIAMVSFISLSMPAITDQLVSTFVGTTEATGNFRRDSTDVRNKIYQRTWDAIVTEPDNLLLGRGVPGPTVLPGYAPAKIGSHSFILGSLLYRQGIVGTTLFLCFWVALINYLYRTRMRRPILCLLVPIYMTLTFAVMEISLINYLLVLIISIEYRQDHHLHHRKLATQSLGAANA